MEDLARYLDRALGVSVPDSGEAALLAWLEAYCNELLQRDFAGLVQLLYRVDVSERGVRAALKGSDGQDAGAILARLIFDRVSRIVEARRRDPAGGEVPKAPDAPGAAGQEPSDEERW